jgi:hypothetical protein
LAQSAETRFQLAGMTLPYSGFPFARALAGLRNAGFDHVAWGVSHEKQPVLAVEAEPPKAAALARQCRDAGLRPVMMFATVHLEAASALDAHRRRIAQAAAAGIPFLLTFGRTTGGDYATVVRNLQGMAADAQQAGVTVVLKQHGGNSGTGVACARIIGEVGHSAIRICYDAGNVLDYENSDPLPDIRACWRDVRAFTIKDHRNWPKDEDCGAGFGEIDHYKLLAPVMRTGLTMPLAFENIFEPLVPRPSEAAGIDRLAARSRDYIESVLRGLQQQESAP